MPAIFSAPYCDLYLPLADNAPIDPNSAAIIDRLATTGSMSVADQIAKNLGPGFTATARTGIYVVDDTVPAVPVPIDSGSWTDELEAIFAEGVPIPANLQTSGNDATAVIYRPSDGRYWEMMGMQKALHFPRLESKTVLAGGTLPLGTVKWKITAFNGNGETDTQATFVTLTISGSNRSVKINWSEIKGGGLLGFRLYRAVGTGAFGRIAEITADSSGQIPLTFTDDGSVTADATKVPPTTNTATTPEWRANFPGRLWDARTSPGHARDIPDGVGGYKERHYWGTSATRIAVAAGIITRDDLIGGEINHTIMIGLPNLPGIIRAGRWSPPAQDSDGHYTNANGAYEGMRMRLPAAFDIDAAATAGGWAPFTSVMARAVQKYGMVVHDGSSATVVYAESPAQYTQDADPYTETYVGSTTTDRRKAISDFPWASLQVLDVVEQIGDGSVATLVTSVRAKQPDGTTQFVGYSDTVVGEGGTKTITVGQ